MGRRGWKQTPLESFAICNQSMKAQLGAARMEADSGRGGLLSRFSLSLRLVTRGCWELSAQLQTRRIVRTPDWRATKLRQRGRGRGRRKPGHKVEVVIQNRGFRYERGRAATRTGGRERGKGRRNAGRVGWFGEVSERERGSIQQSSSSQAQTRAGRAGHLEETRNKPSMGNRARHRRLTGPPANRSPRG